MSTIQSWSPTAASNTAVDGIDIAENCSPANLNNADRAIMANVAALRDLLGGAATTGGSGNAQTLTSGLTLLSYAQGLLIGFEAGFSNTGAATLNVDGLGPKTIKTPAGADLSSAMITAGGIYLVAYEATAGVFILIGAAANSLTATLSAIGALTPIDSNIIVGNGSTWVAESGATARTSLGLGTLDSPQFTALNIGAATDTTVSRVSAGVIAVEGSTVAMLGTADQTLTGGARVTSLGDGTKSSGTYTPDPGDRPLIHITNGGAFTLAPGSNTGSYMLDITNNASAGTITTSGWTKVVGSFTTTSGHKFRCHCSIGNAGSLLVIQALQ